MCLPNNESPQLSPHYLAYAQTFHSKDITFQDLTTPDVTTLDNTSPDHSRMHGKNVLTCISIRAAPMVVITLHSALSGI